MGLNLVSSFYFPKSFRKIRLSKDDHVEVSVQVICSKALRSREKGAQSREKYPKEFEQCAKSTYYSMNAPHPPTNNLFLRHHLLKRTSFHPLELHCRLCILSSEQLVSYLWYCFWIIYTIQLIILSVRLPISQL